MQRLQVRAPVGVGAVKEEGVPLAGPHPQAGAGLVIDGRPGRQVGRPGRARQGEHRLPARLHVAEVKQDGRNAVGGLGAVAVGGKGVVVGLIPGARPVAQQVEGLAVGGRDAGQGRRRGDRLGQHARRVVGRRQEGAVRGADAGLLLRPLARAEGQGGGGHARGGDRDQGVRVRGGQNARPQERARAGRRQGADGKGRVGRGGRPQLLLLLLQKKRRIPNHE